MAPPCTPISYGGWNTLLKPFRPRGGWPMGAASVALVPPRAYLKPVQAVLPQAVPVARSAIGSVAGRPGTRELQTAITQARVNYQDPRFWQRTASNSTALLMVHAPQLSALVGAHPLAPCAKSSDVKRYIVRCETALNVETAKCWGALLFADELRSAFQH